MGAPVSRRHYIAAVGTTVAGAGAGCLDTPARTVDVLSAGSLARTFEDHVGPAFEEETDIGVRGEYYGSNAVMRMVQDRTKHPDVVVSADAPLLRERLYGEFTDWDVEFATNSLGLAYDGRTPTGQQLASDDAWYAVVRGAEEGAVAIGDPELDPLGYRAIQAFAIAEREHDLDGFREAMVERVYREPEEPQMMAGVETGSRAAGVVYRNMAVDHGTPFVEFPDAYDFSNPELADHYGTVSYTTDDGYVAEGRPIIYNATVTDDADAPEAGRRLVRFLAENPEPLATAGLTTDGSLPRPHGAVPAEVIA